MDTPNKENVYVMAKGSSIWEQIIGAAMLVGGAYLFSEWIKKDAEIIMNYKCPRCSYPRLTWGQTECPNCKIDLQWSSDETDKNKLATK